MANHMEKNMENEVENGSIEGSVRIIVLTEFNGHEFLIRD